MKWFLNNFFKISDLMRNTTFNVLLFAGLLIQVKLILLSGIPAALLQ